MNLSRIIVSLAIFAASVVSADCQVLYTAPVAIGSGAGFLDNGPGSFTYASAFGSFAAPTITVTTGGGSYDFDTTRTLSSLSSAGVITTTGFGQPFGPGTAAYTNSNANLQSALGDFAFASNADLTVTLNGLVNGVVYTVQLISLDDRAGAAGRTTTFDGDPASTVSQASNSYVEGTFAATGATQSINVSSFTGFGNFGSLNALVLRRITPEVNVASSVFPVSILLMVGVLFYDKRARVAKVS